MNLLILALASFPLAAAAAPALDANVSTIITTAITAIVGGGFTGAIVNLVTSRRTARIAERAGARDDKALELEKADKDREAALALAAATRESLGEILEQYQKQSETQARTIEGLNTTIQTLNGTIAALQTKSDGDEIARKAAETERDRLLGERDKLEKAHEEALATIATKMAELAAKDAEILSLKLGKSPVDIVSPVEKVTY